MKKEEEIDRLKEVLYSNFNEFNNPVLREVATKLYRLINNGKASLKDQYKRVFIDTLKFLSEVDYLDKNYSLCLKRIKELQQCVVYKNETTSTINHATLRRFQCEIYLGIYQNNHEEIETLKEQLIKFGNINRKKLETNLKEDYDKTFDLANSFLNNSLKTIVNFKLPYKISIPENEEIEYQYKGKLFNLKFKVVNNKTQIPFEATNGVLELDKDKYGVYSCSDLILTFYNFFDATHYMDELLVLCSESFNYFLNYYKSVTDQYWIDNINLSQIQATNATVISENYDDIISIPLYYRQGIVVSDSTSYIDQDKFSELSEMLTKEQEPPLWKTLYLDAKNYIFIEKYKEAVISINSAFENYLNIKSRELLKSEMIDSEIEDYLQGKVSYTTYSLREFISEKDFNKAIEQNLIELHSPSTFQIIRKCFELNNNRITVSRTKLNKLVSKIRKNRNDIIHGNLILLRGIESDAEKSISSFEEFIKEFQ